MTASQRHPFLRAIAAGPVLCDGAMGTVLLERHPDLAVPESLNLGDRNRVQEVHQEYIAAGARVLQTNTYGVNRHRLGRHGMESQTYRLAQEGVRAAIAAREVAGADVWIAGSLGPTGRPLAPLGDISKEEAADSFREVAEAMLERGVDLFVLETFADLDEMRAALEAVRALCRLPIVAQMAFGEAGQTERGVTPAAAVQALADAGADVVGANCAVGPEMTLDALHQMRAAGLALPLAAQPNAGFPRQAEGRLLYTSGPEYFARFAPRAVEVGACLVGGCCGTTPAHIAAMSEALASQPDTVGTGKQGGEVHEPAALLVRYPQTATAVEEATAPLVEGRERQTFGEKLGRKFVVSVEIDPPKGLNPKKALDGARMLHEQGVDAVNIADSPMARVRMSGIALAHLMQREVGIETVLHFTCRDRNLMALQSDLIGAHALGLRNILALTGDRTRHSDYPGATDVFNVESWGLVSILAGMNNGVDLAGNSLGRKTRFVIGCAASPAEPDLDRELERYRRKVEASAGFVFTQPLWELGTLERWLERTADLPRLPLLLGIWPLQSARQTEFLANEVPGIYIPDTVRRRMAEAGEDAQKVGIELAQNLLHEAAGLVQGIYLMPSFGRYEVCAEVLQAAPHSGRVK